MQHFQWPENLPFHCSDLVGNLYQAARSALVAARQRHGLLHNAAKQCNEGRYPRGRGSNSYADRRGTPCAQLARYSPRFWRIATFLRSRIRKVRVSRNVLLDGAYLAKERVRIDPAHRVCPQHDIPQPVPITGQAVWALGVDARPKVLSCAFSPRLVHSTMRRKVRGQHLRDRCSRTLNHRKENLMSPVLRLCKKLKRDVCGPLKPTSVRSSYGPQKHIGVTSFPFYQVRTEQRFQSGLGFLQKPRLTDHG
jgi:hypothetical protein